MSPNSALINFYWQNNKALWIWFYNFLWRGILEDCRSSHNKTIQKSEYAIQTIKKCVAVFSTRDLPPRESNVILVKRKINNEKQTYNNPLFNPLVSHFSLCLSLCLCLNLLCSFLCAGSMFIWKPHILAINVWLKMRKHC